MTQSVLDDLGQEVTGIAAPVAICMAITVLFVKVLNPDGDTNSSVMLATLAYTEQVATVADIGAWHVMGRVWCMAGDAHALQRCLCCALHKPCTCEPGPATCANGPQEQHTDVACTPKAAQPNPPRHTCCPSPL